MKIHFDPYISRYDPHGEDEPMPWCGTPVTENTDVSDRWQHITCKKCLNRKDELIKAHQNVEAMIVKEMGEFVDFIESEKQKP